MRIRYLALKWIVLVVALLSMLGSFYGARADSWGPPTPEHWSANRQFVLKVDDSKNRLTLQQKRAAGFLTLWSIPYPQTWAPEDAYITDNGRYVVLQDQHGNLGGDKIFLFVGPSGAILKRYTLQDLLTLSEILDAMHSVSSTWWSVYGQFFFTAQQTRFACVTQLGTIRCFDLATGARLDTVLAVKQQIRNEAILRARTLLNSPVPEEHTTGIVQVGGLGDHASVPTLTHLFDVPRQTGNQKQKHVRSDEDTALQYRAACALVKLLKGQAAPLLEAHLHPMASDWTSTWVSLYAKTGQARFSPKIRRLAHSGKKDIRSSAIEALLEGGNAALIRHNHAWLTDTSAHVRYLVVRNLSEYGGNQDLLLLRRALHDHDEFCQLWALRGLIRLHAPELPTLLQHCLHAPKPTEVHQEAQMELARRGDSVQLKRLVAWVRTLRHHSHEHEGWGTEEMDAEDVCEVLAVRRPPNAVSALHAAAKCAYADIQRPALGALAVMGEKDALVHLRRFATNGDALQRANALEWLVRCKDRASVPLLQAAQGDEDPIIRDTAVKALQTLAPQGASHP